MLINISNDMIRYCLRVAFAIGIVLLVKTSNLDFGVPYWVTLVLGSTMVSSGSFGWK